MFCLVCLLECCPFRVQASTMPERLAQLEVEKTSPDIVLFHLIHFTSPRNLSDISSHHLASPHPNGTSIPHHHHQRIMETQQTTSRTPPQDGTVKGWFAQKIWFGECVGWWFCTDSIGKHFLWLIVFFLVLPPSARSGATCMFCCFSHS